MTEQNELALYVIDRLEAAGMEYVVVGSYASGIHGEPRATNDIDIVIRGGYSKVEDFAARLDEGKYLSLQAAKEAFARQSLFQVIDTMTGWKVDLIPRKRRPYDIEAFNRRVMRRLLDREIQVLSPEDVILSKLEWSRKAGGSETQLRDVESVALLQWEFLDFEYLRRWAPELAVTDDLEALLERIAKLKHEAF